MPNTKILPNGIMVVADDTHISKWVEQANDIEIARAFIAQYSRYIKPGSTVIDVGACIGDHTATYANLVGPTGRVIALECGGESFTCLSYNMERHPNVVPLRLAAGKEPGLASFVRSPNIGASYLQPAKAGPVQVTTIDALADALALSTGFIKIDAEGWELLVLQGAYKTIKSHMPHMVLEINEGALNRQGATRHDVFAHLEAMGYNWVILGRDAVTDPQYDILAYPKT